MFTEKIDLYKYFGVERMGGGGYLNVYVPSLITEIKPKIRPAMLIIAGGAYTGISQRETEVVAIKYMANGFTSFTLDYSVNIPYPTPLIEACMAVAYIRQNAKKFNIDAEHVAATGFSAGGHLAAMLSNLYYEKEIVCFLGDKVELARINAAVLSYPVITMGRYAHATTRDIITGGSEQLAELLSMEKRVTVNTPPTFIWHTVNDDCVPTENSMLYAEACRKAGVPFALHIFERGKHGLSLCNEETDKTDEDMQFYDVGKWFGLALDWLKFHGFCVRTVS